MDLSNNIILINRLNEMWEQQERRLFKLGRSIVPTLTKDDMLQPMDFKELESNVFFKFEEGVLCGIGEARAALLAELKNNN